jgi:methyl-accepting chemotaxis protein
MQTVNINEISDIDKLKSMAYDQVVTLEQTQNNLNMINQRINQVTQDNTQVEPPVDNTSTDEGSVTPPITE